MKKVISILACLCLLVSMTVCAVSAGSATIDFTDIANRVSYSTEQQVWAQNDITVTNDKAGSISNVGDFGGNGYPARFYKTSALKIEYTGMTQIVFNCDDYKTSYPTDLAASIEDGTVTVDGTKVTVTFDAPVDMLEIPELAAQVRVINITVSAEAAPIEPSEPSQPAEPTWEVATSLEAGVTYKLGMDQTAKAATYYFTGEMSGYFGATETDITKAVDMFVEVVEGGYKLFFNDANGKQYINLVQSGTHYNFTFGAEGSVFTWDAEKNALYAPCGDQICYMGTYGNYVTVGTLTTAKLKDTDYIARLYALVEVDNGGDNTGDNTGSTTTTTNGGATTTTTTTTTAAGNNAGSNNPAVSSWQVAKELKAGTTYKLGLDQTAKGATYFFTGAMSGYYGATETDITKAVDMFVEVVEGGYKLYFNADGAKNYVKLEQSGTHYNFTFGSDASIFTWDAEKNALCATAGDQVCYMGTYGNYVTVGTLTTAKLKDTDYIARLYALQEGDNGVVDNSSTNATTGAGDTASKTEDMGEDTTVIVLALSVMALAFAGVVASKKRA